MKNEKCVLFHGESSAVLANDIIECAKYNSLEYIDYNTIELGGCYHHRFPSGESYCQLQESVRGADVFILQSGINPVNDNLMQLLVMADAARRASAGRITAVCPTFFYQRQERKDKSRVPISAKLTMDIMAAAGINRLIVMDLHAPQIVGMTNMPVDHLYFRPTLINALEDKDIDVVVSPDVGGVKRAEEYAKQMGTDLAFVFKNRVDDTTVKPVQFVGNVKDKNVLIIDDLTESGGTLVMAAELCKQHGANKVYTAVSHACLTPMGSSRLQEAYEDLIIDGFYCSNTATKQWVGNGWGTVINVASTFTKAIECVHNNESISSLFNIK